MPNTNIRILILQHLAHEGAGAIATWAFEKVLDVKTIVVPMHTGSLPPPDSFEVLVVLGGTMGVYEEDVHSWMTREKAFIQEAIAAGKTVIGICLGSQLLAEALGSKVYPHKQKEIGFFPVYKTAEGANEPALDGIPQAWPVFHWHGDTFDLPPGAQHLFFSEACANQAFRKDNCWGFQFHPEMNQPLLEDMIAFEPSELIGKGSVQTAAEIRAAFIRQNNVALFYKLLNNITRI